MGHPQLCFNRGFFFRFSSQTDNKVNWKCIENCCKAKCNTEGSTIGEEYSVNFNEAKDRKHNHALKQSRFEIKEKRRKIKKATIVTSKVISNVAPKKVQNRLLTCHLMTPIDKLFIETQN
ncbi:unnamed protein product [Brachionus calyciflorus]|uniref:FLYWCH-type domain-containing protein n=1 Tax=Brachionus calyciflorus TaxID=104777 RepID=A0A814L9F7_9BILA|nr:unnamed protein product [Brachionus calyciflorus]